MSLTVSIPGPRVGWRELLPLPAYALLFLMSTFPMVPALSQPKEFLFGVLLLTIGTVTFLTGRFCLDMTVALWTFLLSAASFFFVLRGFLAGAPGAAPTASVYVLWPIIYCFAIAGVLNERIVTGLTRALIVSAICIALHGQLILLTKTHLLPGDTLVDLLSFDWKPARFVPGEGYIFMQYPGLNSLPFLVPFCLAFATSSGRTEAVRSLRRFWLGIVAFMVVLAVPMTGRRTLYLVTLAAPVLTLLFSSFLPSLQRRLNQKALLRVTLVGVLSAAAGLACLQATYGFNLLSLTKRFSQGFTFSAGTGDKGASYRREQFYALLGGWGQNPLLGAGHGAAVYGSVRSPLSPWEYELYYMALLHQTGILGFAAYASGVLWIYWMGIRVIREGGRLSALMVACLVGLSSVLIATTADHIYLPRYDGLWTIFFPLAVINFWLVRTPTTRPVRYEHAA